MLQYLLARAKEPSTWRGLAWVATACGISLNPDQITSITAAGMALSGVIGAFMPDGSGGNGGR